MKNSIKILAAIAMFGFAGNASAQNTATANGTANATVVAAITLTPSSSLNFGPVASPASATTVVLTDANAITYNGGTDPGTSHHGLNTVQTFTAAGEATYGFSITRNLPTGDLTVKSGSNTASVTLNADPASGIVGGVGGTWSVGGTLNLGAGQAAGVYVNDNVSAGQVWEEQVQYN